MNRPIIPMAPCEYRPALRSDVTRFSSSNGSEIPRQLSFTMMQDTKSGLLEGSHPSIRYRAKYYRHRGVSLQTSDDRIRKATTLTRTVKIDPSRGRIQLVAMTLGLVLNH